MDFTKFVSLLDRQALFFARYDKFADPFEGSYPKSSLLENPEFFLAFYKHYTAWRELVILNCWHVNEYESAAMWELYLHGSLGVAIQSTVEYLKESFECDPENVTSIGNVTYIDYETEKVPLGNSFYPFMFKRKDYEHERELRAIIVKQFPVSPDHKMIIPKEFFELGGEYIPVRLDTLIQRVLVVPTAPRWFKDLIESVTKRYGFDVEVVFPNWPNLVL